MEFKVIGKKTTQYITTSQDPTTTDSTSTIMTTLLQTDSEEPSKNFPQMEYSNSSETNWNVIIPIISVLVVIGFLVALLIYMYRKCNRGGNREANGQPTDALKSLDMQYSIVKQSADDGNVHQQLPDLANGSPYMPEDDDHNKSLDPLLLNEGAHSVNIESPADDKKCRSET